LPSSTKSASEAFSVGSLFPVFLCPSDAGRDACVIHNTVGTLLVCLGGTASSSNFTYRLINNCTVEINGFSGRISAIKTSGPETPVNVTQVF
jgi:hypothetical protein